VVELCHGVRREGLCVTITQEVPGPLGRALRLEPFRSFGFGKRTMHPDGCGEVETARAREHPGARRDALRPRRDSPPASATSLHAPNRELEQPRFGTDWDGLGSIRIHNVPLLFLAAGSLGTRTSTEAVNSPWFGPHVRTVHHSSGRASLTALLTEGVTSNSAWRANSGPSVVVIPSR
jgi:hypothetical protein